MLIYLLFKSEEHEWDKMRELANNDSNEPIIKKYFS